MFKRGRNSNKVIGPNSHTGVDIPAFEPLTKAIEDLKRDIDLI